MTSPDISGGPWLLGLDLGISTVKAAIVSPYGDIAAVEADEYLVMPDGDRVEADPEVYWAPLARSIRRLLVRWGGRVDRIAAVAVSSHTETVFSMGRDGQPVRPALVWMDARSAPEAAELARLIGSQRVLEISGQPEITPIWPLTKLRWLRKNEPDNFARTACFLLPHDYVVYRLCGRYVCEPTLWSSSLALDIRRRTWSDELLEFAGVTAAQLPQLYPSGAVVGRISDACAAETGLSSRTQVVTGALDQACGALGAGNVAPGTVTESTGSVLALLATISEPILNLAYRVPCHVHALPGTYCLLPWNPTGGLTLKWFKDRFAPDLAAEAAASGRDVYDLLSAQAAGIPPGSEGLVMLPDLQGALFPEYEPAARGVFFGFTLSHTRAHFTRAIMEAVAFMIRRDLEGIRGLGVEVREVRVLGGGARSGLWSQIKADVLGLPVVVPSQHEAAVLGAAILAASGIGLYPDIYAAVGAMAREGSRLAPDLGRQAVYQRAFELYVALFDAVRPLFADAAAVQGPGAGP